MTQPSVERTPDQLEHRLQRLESELEQLRSRSRAGRTLTLVAFTVLASSGVLGVSSVLAADGACPNGLPFCFGPGTPARAGEINHNFAQLLEWLEQKAGAVEDPDLSPAGNVSVGGDVSVAGNVRLEDEGGNALVALDGTNPQHGSVAVRTPNGTLAASQDFAFFDTGDNWLRLRNGANAGYMDLAVRDLWVDGTVHFSRGSCRRVVVSSPSVHWIECADGEFMAGADVDTDDNDIAGILCCRL